MNLLNKLTIKNLKMNKKRTIVTIIGILLSVALMMAVASMYASAVASLIDFQILRDGNFHEAFFEVPKGELSTFQENRKIEKIYLAGNIGYAHLAESKNAYKPYFFIKAFDEEALSNLGFRLVEGRYPNNGNEIVIPTHLKTNGRVTYHVGDTLTLEVGTRLLNGEEVGQTTPYIPSDNVSEEVQEEFKEELVDTKTKTYTIVGIIERPSDVVEPYDAPGYTLVTYLEDEQDLDAFDIYARYTKEGLKSYLEVTGGILGIDPIYLEKRKEGNFKTSEEFEEMVNALSQAKYSYQENEYLITLETNPLGDGAIKGLGNVAAIVIFIIIFTSVFCIKNSFDISITEKIKQYGMLRSIGATKKQIKRNVFYEATILGLIGIPLGLLSGIFASYILILVSNYFLGDFFTSQFHLHFEFSSLAIVVAIVLGIVTIYLSALKSARKASKVSPIDSIRNSADIKMKSKKLKNPKIIKKIFGIGGVISYKNLKRNKRKYRTTTISIAVSVLTFVALSSFMQFAFSTLERSMPMSDANVELSLDIDTKEDYELVRSTTQLNHVVQFSVTEGLYLDIENVKFNPKYAEVLDIDLDEEESYGSGIMVVTLDDDSYQEYLKKIHFTSNDKNQGILIDMRDFSICDSDDECTNYHMREFDFEKGDFITFTSTRDEKFTVEVGRVTEEIPFGYPKYGNVQMLIIPSELYYQYEQYAHLNVYYKADDADALQDEIEMVLKDREYYLENQDQNYRMMKSLFTLVGIFLYGFIIVISLIGITNIFNTITTNMELRKQEFAMLKSIGMTKKEFSRMIELESIFMGVKSLFFGISIGLGLSYLIYHSLVEESGYPYQFPLFAIVIAIIAVFLLISCLMRYSMHKIQKQNTIETIRNENI